MHSEPDSVFGQIGLTLSGGGYRAAAFHLGTLAYLDRVGALSHVRTLSTVSGGTFTGASFALSLIRSEPFDDFYARFYAQLRDVNLVELGLDQLDDRPVDVPSGRRDLIVAMANVYARTFFGDASRADTFGEILDADLPIREIVFNATEFRKGIDFRFQTSLDAKAEIGNEYLAIPPEAAKKIRLADVVAASSCFPGGFEPFAFPSDFAWPGGAVPDELRTPDFEKDLPLMDGGVYDNQGIDSLLLAEKRAKIDYDMIVISDVDQKEEDIFPFPKTKSIGLLGRLRLQTVVWLLWLLMVLSAVTFFTLLLGLFTAGGFSWSLFFTHVVPMLLALGTAYGIWVIRDEVDDKLLPLIPNTERADRGDLGRLRMDQLAEMINLRLRSVVAMAATIFMKRIRALGYRRIYWDEKYNRKRMSNLVYHLATGEEFAEDLEGLVKAPSAALRRVADVAASMPTTLWFEKDKPDQLPSLVFCGRATTCYNLMKFVVRRHGRDPSAFPDPIRALWHRLVHDWETFLGGLDSGKGNGSESGPV